MYSVQTCYSDHQSVVAGISVDRHPSLSSSPSALQPSSDAALSPPPAASAYPLSFFSPRPAAPYVPPQVSASVPRRMVFPLMPLGVTRH